MPKIQLSAEEQRRFCRFEISQKELLHGINSAECQMNESYRICAEDLLAALQNIKKRNLSPAEYANDWF